MKKLTTEDFITKAKSIHGDIYDYSLVRYSGYAEPVLIVCKVHGEFSQSPDSHLQGRGCSKCGITKKTNSRKLTIEEFIQKSISIYGDKYDYSLIVEYKNNRTHVPIICKIHGTFNKLPSNFLQGSGCPKCSHKHQYTTNEFIERAREIHGDLYDYSLVSYKNAREKISIICNTHGTFKEAPTLHLNGHGCMKCSTKLKLTNNDFIKRAVEVHGCKYIYDKVVYKNISHQVDIICPIHGMFRQTPQSHLIVKGCKRCRTSKGERKIDSLLNYNMLKFERQKTFSGCFNKKQLQFDFFLPNQNLCIEYNGEQHYKPIPYFGGNKKFNQMKKNDEIKKRFCFKNGIILVTISYDEDVNAAFQEKVLDIIQFQTII